MPACADAARGEKYNHSTFCDLVISGIAGVRCGNNGGLTVDPLFEENQLDYMCVDGVLIGGRYFTVIWDKTGERYGRGKGFLVLLEGKQIARSDKPMKIDIGYIK